MRMSLVLLAGALSVVGQANACSWIGIHPDNVKTLLPERYAQADAVVYGKVISLEEDDWNQKAEVSAIRRYKGAGEKLQIESHLAMCAYMFTLNEERVFFIHGNSVSVETVEPASPWLLRALEQLSKSAPNKPLQATRETRAPERRR